MRPTVEYLRERVAYWLDCVFITPIPLPPIGLSRSNSTLGQVRFKRSGKFNPKFSEFRILFSGSFEFSEELLDDVILHELIHYHILYHQKVDTSPHGQLFRALMKTINERFGRHITISHRTDRPHATQQRRKYYYVAVGKVRDGRYIVTSSRKKDMAKVDKLIRKDSRIVQHGWFKTSKEFFKQFPVSDDYKAYIVPTEEVKAQLGELIQF